ncbi:hypothetical protein J2Y41_000211 [Arthrobacter sp. 1088]|uniref:hypothetical protein n=1 Tax=Arthrobacter sp. 1088 TaxID=2817768 RepID=UPI00285833C4|nr:hypothetical protein [Arthrobacter sp. 1088]MDR6684664.1 hypothetical protein [Arthrobacter sp. 1088]
MRRVPALGVLAVAAVALAGCSGGGGSAASPSSTTTSSAPTSASAPAQEKVYSEDELRELISGMRDGDGNELKLYSKEQVDQGGKIADLLLNTASVDPEDCKDIATAGLVDKVEHGDVAVALSDSDQPRSLSAQSGSEGPDAEKVLKDISGNMDKCAKFTVKAVGQTYEVSSEELDAKTKAKETFGTISTRSDESQKKLMQVSAADGRLLVVATKSGPSLGDPDQKELEDLINKVLAKAEGGSETPGEMMSSSSGSMTSSPSSMSSSPSSKSLTPTPTMSTSEGSVTSSSSPSTSP